MSYPCCWLILFCRAMARPPAPSRGSHVKVLAPGIVAVPVAEPWKCVFQMLRECAAAAASSLGIAAFPRFFSTSQQTMTRGPL